MLLPILVQEGWCDGVGSVEEIQAKLLKRQEAAAKRERAMAYALAHQVRINVYDCCPQCNWSLLTAIKYEG